MKKEHKRRKKGKMVVFAVLIVVILAAVAIVVSRNAKKEEPEIISLTALEKMSGIWLWKKELLSVLLVIWCVSLEQR